MKGRSLEFADKLTLEKNLLSNINQLQKMPVVKRGIVKTSMDVMAKLSSMSQDLVVHDGRKQETGLVPYTENPSNTALEKVDFPKKSKKNEIIDFSSFDKHHYMTDKAFLYCKRVGNPIEYIECAYSELSQNSKSKNKKIRTKANTEYITVSKNVS